MSRATRMKIAAVAAATAGVMAVSGCSGFGSGSSGSGGSGSEKSSSRIGLDPTLSYAEAREAVHKTLTGKSVVYIPFGLGIALTDAWNDDLKQSFDTVGIKYTVKDPAFDTQKQLQALESAIAEKPDVIIIHNGDPQLTAKALEDAQAKGIYVIQLNLQSTTMTDAYVGADFDMEGAGLAEMTAEKCAGKKVALIHNLANLTSDIQQTAGFKRVAKEKGIEIVSEQDGNLDRTKNAQIATTVMKQYPDLCAIAAFYDDSAIGAATAVSQAGGKIPVFMTTAGDAACTAMRDGQIAGAVGSNGRRVGIVAAAEVQQLIESGQAAGKQHYYLFTPLYHVTKDNYADANICFNVTK